MPFSDFASNPEIIHRLREMLARNRFPHAVILSGAHGSGKYTLALMLARAMNCLEPPFPGGGGGSDGLPDFCGHCSNCTRIAQALDLDSRFAEAVVARENLRDTDKILAQAAGTLDFSQPVAIMLMAILHYIKDLGHRSLEAIESGNLTDLGRLMDEHWTHKKQRSKQMSNPDIDRWYGLAMENGALGGKLIGAGGGGFLLFYTEQKGRLRQALRGEGLVEVNLGFDYEGTKIL